MASGSLPTITNGLWGIRPLARMKINIWQTNFSAALSADLTFFAEQVTLRTNGGALFDAPTSQTGVTGIQSLNNLNENYEVVWHELFANRLIVTFRDTRNNHTLIIDRHLLRNYH